MIHMKAIGEIIIRYDILLQPKISKHYRIYIWKMANFDPRNFYPDQEIFPPDLIYLLKISSEFVPFNWDIIGGIRYSTFCIMVYVSGTKTNILKYICSF